VGGPSAPDGLVLWDPCDSGRAYLREEALLRSVYLGDQGLDIPPDPAGSAAGGAETLGTVYDAVTVQAMAKLALESCPGPLPGHVLALLRPERPPRRAVREWLSDQGADLAEAAGQEQLISVWPLKSVVPEATLGTIVSWLAGVAGPERSTVVLAAAPRATVCGPGGEDVDEEVVYLGPDRLFGVVTRPPAPAPVAGATVVLLNSGRIDHVGPGRLWVELARSWAATGLSVVRVDLSGLGDSPARAGQPADVVYSPGAVDDVAEIARAVSPADPSAVVLMGLCSGAYHSVQAALATGARGVVSINLVPPDPPGTPAAPSPDADPDRPGYRERLGAAKATLRRWGSRLPGHHYLGALSRRAEDVKWWLVHRARGGEVPAFLLRRLARAGVSTLVLSGSYEGRLVRQGEGLMLWRLEKKSAFRMVVLPNIDHTLFTQGARHQVLPLLTERVMAQCANTAPAGAHRSPQDQPAPRLAPTV
jgi:acetyl esterase/lipase